MNRTPLSIAIVLASLLECTEPEASGPPTLHVGVGACADCGMSVLEPAYAAAALFERDGRREHAVFDDVGCMRYWEAQLANARILEMWSGVVDAEGWFNVNAGHFVVGSDIRTPMDFHIVCCASSAAADELVHSRGGTCVSCVQVQPVLSQKTATGTPISVP